MVAAKDFFLTAKHGSTIAMTIVGQVVATDGTLTDGTSGSLRGQIKTFRVTSKPTKDNISSNDSDKANNVPIEENLRLELEEKQRRTLRSNVCSALMAAYDLFKITFAYGSKTYGPYYMYRDEFSDGIEGKGNNDIRSSFDLADVGQTAVLPYAEA